MIVISIVLILLASFPLLITLKRIRRYRLARHRGGNTVATVTHIRTHRYVRGLPYDRLTLVYHNLETGKSSTGQVSTVHDKYKPGDRVTIAYQTSTGDVIIPDDVAGFYPILGFGIVLLLFVLFAVYKLSEMLETGF
jgi:hypothetical protein